MRGHACERDKGYSKIDRYADPRHIHGSLPSASNFPVSFQLSSSNPPNVKFRRFSQKYSSLQVQKRHPRNNQNIVPQMLPDPPAAAYAARPQLAAARGLFPLCHYDSPRRLIL